MAGEVRAWPFEEARAIIKRIGGAETPEALGGDLGIFFAAFDADPAPPQALRHGGGGAGTQERIEHDIAGLAGGEDDTLQQGFRLLRRMRLTAVLFKPLGSGA